MDCFESLEAKVERISRRAICAGSVAQVVIDGVKETDDHRLASLISQ